VAKLLGVRVEQFAIGFGKRLVGFRRGETDYRINALPFGGYVKMSGENPMDDRTGDPREFMSHPRWHRFLIAIAGPAMNVIFAVGLLTVVYAVHYEYPSYWDQPAVIGFVEEDTPAAKAGLLPGDRIVRIEDVVNPTWQQVLPLEALNPNQPLHVTLQRDGHAFDKTVTPVPEGADRLGSAGWDPSTGKAIVTELESGMPAEKAGIKVGDELVSVNGQRVMSLLAMIDLLKHTKSSPIQVTVLRNGEQKEFTLQPVLSKVEGEERYRVGIGSNVMTVTTLPLGAALSRSIEQNKEGSLLILELVQKMIKGQISPKSIQGPIGISVAAGKAAQRQGWMPLLELTAAISLNLGIFNLLPIPILDGGVIMLLLIEGVMRRDISLVIKERIYQAAFVFLVLFAGMVIYNDLAKTLPGVMQKLP
jgi:regulator of sigma E protease